MIKICGIIGMALAPFKERSDADVRAYRFMLLSMWLDSVSRGRDAAGLAIINRNKQWNMMKAPLNSVDFRFNQVKAVDAFLNKVTKTTTIVIGHVRLGTKGDKLDNRNNHPIEVGSVYGVHNGMLSNDDDIAEDMGFKKTAEVDSEVIFNLLDQSLVDGAFTQEGVEEVFPKLHGSFAIASFSKQDPYSLLLAKRDKPIKMMYAPENKVLFFASEYRFLENAVYGCNEMSRMFNLGVHIDAKDFDDLGKVDSKDEGIIVNVKDMDEEVSYEPISVKVWDREYGGYTTTPYNNNVQRGREWRGTTTYYGKDKDEDKKPDTEKKDTVVKPTTTVDKEEDFTNPFDNTPDMTVHSSPTLVQESIDDYLRTIESDIQAKQAKNEKKVYTGSKVVYPEFGKRGVGVDTQSGLGYEIGYTEAAKRYFKIGYEEAIKAFKKTARYYGLGGYV